MNARSAFLSLLLALLVLPVAPSAWPAAAAALPDKAGCTDPALFPTRMPGYRIESCEAKEYDSFEFWNLKPPHVAVEGKKTVVMYQWPEGNPTIAPLQIVRNYENAIKKAGGTIHTIVTTGTGPYVNGTIVKDGKEAWIQVSFRGGSRYYMVTIVEKQAMEQYVEANAASFGNDLDTTGHTSVYGIYFDTGKAELKPESTPALEEVTKLLVADPKLKLWVVGHTDWVGKLEDNMALSQARADAVVKALTTAHGIAPARLRAFGSGPLAPVASNATEEGRGKNRRVELVKQP